MILTTESIFSKKKDMIKLKDEKLRKSIEKAIIESYKDNDNYCIGIKSNEIQQYFNIANKRNNRKDIIFNNEKIIIFDNHIIFNDDADIKFVGCMIIPYTLDYNPE